MKFEEYVGRVCTSRTAYEFIPKSKRKINLKKIEDTLRKNKIFIEIASDIIILIKYKGKPISIFKSGKILIKETNDEKTAKQIIKALVKLIEKNEKNKINQKNQKK